eukprot:9560864-Alexandrium_andersonii.AAC.1
MHMLTCRFSIVSVGFASWSLARWLIGRPASLAGWLAVEMQKIWLQLFIRASVAAYADDVATQLRCNSA